MCRYLRSHDRLPPAEDTVHGQVGFPTALGYQLLDLAPDQCGISRIGMRSRELCFATQEAMSIGVTGVPAFLLDGRLLVLGAQPEEVFERAFEQLDGQRREEPDAAADA